jgi:hypothetical protein
MRRTHLKAQLEDLVDRTGRVEGAVDSPRIACLASRGV